MARLVKISSLILLCASLAHSQFTTPIVFVDTTFGSVVPPASVVLYDSMARATSQANLLTLNWTQYTTTAANYVYALVATMSQWNSVNSATVDGNTMELVHDTLRSDAVHLWLYRGAVSSAASHAIHIGMDDRTDMGGCSIALRNVSGGAPGVATQGNSTSPSIQTSYGQDGLAIGGFFGATFTPDAGITVRASVTDMGGIRKFYLCTKASTAGNTTLSGTQSSGVWAAVATIAIGNSMSYVYVKTQDGKRIRFADGNYLTMRAQ